MSKKKDLLELFETYPSGTLFVDNDMCYFRGGEMDEEYGEYEVEESFNYGPKELAFMFGSALGYNMEMV